ncbi:MAG TPA: sulfatase-like hydrolase/transferase [Pirellulales bacterium]|nr:sulfatase-like hydrolase/transferase [Pirellulales bacterium]
MHLFLRSRPACRPGLGIAVILFAACGFAGRLEADERPNVILMLADDFGFECLGANGGTSYGTPHLDDLAATGARFEHCYAQPLCTPTRAQLMTGQSNVRNYVRFGFLDPQQITFAHLFRQAGYVTGIAGKWQLGGGFDGPRQFGFDEYCLWQLTRRPPRYANPGLEIDGRQIDFDAGEYGPDLIQQYALEFVRKHKDHPFLLYYPMMLTHRPFQPTPDSPDWDPRAIGEEVNQDEKHFREMTQYMDKQVGELVALLEEVGLRKKKTLVIFLGDNGTAKVDSQWRGITVHGAKAQAIDAGTRVPLIVNWPGRIPAGRVVADLVDTTDFLPTLCDAATIPIPTMPPIDGQTFLPLALGAKSSRRDWLYTWYAPNQGRVDEPIEFARTHGYKLFRNGVMHRLDDRYHEEPLDANQLDAEATAARQKLQTVLDRYAGARPPALASIPDK